jgi:hypothetical protein
MRFPVRLNARSGAAFCGRPFRLSRVPSRPREVVKQALFEMTDLLTALSRSRHFGPSENGFGDEFRPPSAARRSLFQG